PRRIRPLAAPTPDHRPNLFRPVELSDTQLTEVALNAAETRGPIRLRALREVLEVFAALVEDDKRPEATRVRRTMALNRFVVGGQKLWGSGLAAQTRAAAPRVVIRVAFGARLSDSLQLNGCHCVPRTPPARDPGHLDRMKLRRQPS